MSGAMTLSCVWNIVKIRSLIVQLSVGYTVRIRENLLIAKTRKKKYLEYMGVDETIILNWNRKYIKSIYRYLRQYTTIVAWHNFILHVATCFGCSYSHLQASLQ